MICAAEEPRRGRSPLDGHSGPGRDHGTGLPSTQLSKHKAQGEPTKTGTWPAPAQKLSEADHLTAWCVCAPAAAVVHASRPLRKQRGFRPQRPGLYCDIVRFLEQDQ